MSSYSGYHRGGNGSPYSDSSVTTGEVPDLESSNPSTHPESPYRPSSPSLSRKRFQRPSVMAQSRQLRAPSPFALLLAALSCLLYLVYQSHKMMLILDPPPGVPAPHLRLETLTAPTVPRGAAGQRARKLQVLKAGGIPKEGLGSSLGFITATANIAHLLDAELLFTQTAEMMGYRVSDILNRNNTIAIGRTCDIMEVLLHDPWNGRFQERMDRAQRFLDETYETAIKKCNGETPDAPLLSEYALKELDKCDVLVINDFRTISKGWTNCSMAWWKETIDPYSGPAQGNDVAIHFRWGDVYQKAQENHKWRMDMEFIAPLIDIIRQERPGIKVNVFMKRSKENESDARLREILSPLSGDFNIVEAESDVEELSLMGKAEYLFINSGSYSLAAAATGKSQVVVFNDGGEHNLLKKMRMPYFFQDYRKIDAGEFRSAIRATTPQALGA